MAHLTDIVLIGGFLGSGKTTYLNQIFAKSDKSQKTAVVVNEFGSVPIDGELLNGRDYVIKEITGGCVCCSLKEKFIDGLKSIIETEEPDLIFVEATGLASPWDMKENIEKRFPDHVRVKDVLITLDIRQYAKFHGKLRVYDNQFRGAPQIILTKSDLYPSEEFDQFQFEIKTADEQMNVQPLLHFKDDIVSLSFQDFHMSTDLEDEISNLIGERSNDIVRMKALYTIGGMRKEIHFDGHNLFFKELDRSSDENSYMALFCHNSKKEDLEKAFSVVLRSDPCHFSKPGAEVGA